MNRYFRLSSLPLAVCSILANTVFLIGSQGQSEAAFVIGGIMLVHFCVGLVVLFWVIKKQSSISPPFHEWAIETAGPLVVLALLAAAGGFQVLSVLSADFLGFAMRLSRAPLSAVTARRLSCWICWSVMWHNVSILVVLLYVVRTSKTDRIWMLPAILSSCLGVMWGTVCICFHCRRSNVIVPPADDRLLSLCTSPMRSIEIPSDVTYGELRSACQEWSIDAQIGAGRSGTVYQAQLPQFGHVAVKCFNKLGARMDQRDEFFQEFQLLCRLRHPHLLEILTVASDAPEVCFVCHFMEGGSLSSALHSTPIYFPSADRMKIALQTLSALAYLHGQSYLHRDVKSSNILLNNAWQSARLADFGLLTLPPTQGTSVAGSLGCKAPELVGCSASVQGDSYALGVVFLEVATRQLAWDPTAYPAAPSLVKRLEDQAREKPLEGAEPTLTSLLHLGFNLSLADPNKRATARSMEYDGEIQHLFTKSHSRSSTVISNNSMITSRSLEGAVMREFLSDRWSSGRYGFCCCSLFLLLRSILVIVLLLAAAVAAVFLWYNFKFVDKMTMGSFFIFAGELCWLCASLLVCYRGCRSSVRNIVDNIVEDQQNSEGPSQSPLDLTTARTWP